MLENMTGEEFKQDWNSLVWNNQEARIQLQNAAFQIEKQTELLEIIANLMPIIIGLLIVIALLQLVQIVTTYAAAQHAKSTVYRP